LRFLLVEGSDAVADHVEACLASLGAAYTFTRAATLGEGLVAVDSADVALVEFRLPDSPDPENTLRRICEAAEPVGCAVIGFMGAEDAEVAAAELRHCARLSLFKDELEASELERTILKARSSALSGRQWTDAYAGNEAARLMRYVQRRPADAVETMFQSLKQQLDQVLLQQRMTSGEISTVARRVQQVEETLKSRDETARELQQAVLSLRRRIRPLSNLAHGDLNNGIRPLAVRIDDLEKHLLDSQSEAREKERTHRDLFVQVVPVVVGILFTILGWVASQLWSAQSHTAPVSAHAPEK
jgi:hypothetical protein